MVEDPGEEDVAKESPAEHTMQAAPETKLFDEIRATHWGVLLIFVSLHTLLTAFFFTYLFQEYVTHPLEVATRGLVTHALVSNLIEIVVLVGGVALIMGRLRPRDIGLQARGLPNALVVTYLLWALVLMVSVLAGEIDGTLAWNRYFTVRPGTLHVGNALGGFLGTGLSEELAYRGFLLPQLYLLSRRRLSPGKALAFAIVCSQGFFGLNHVPAGLVQGFALSAIALYVFHAALMGVFLAGIYLRTGNLFVAIGVHAIVNDPMLPIVSGINSSVLALALSVLLLFLWPYLSRLFGEVFTLRPALAQSWAIRSRAGEPDPPGWL